MLHTQYKFTGYLKAGKRKTRRSKNVAQKLRKSEIPERIIFIKHTKIKIFGYLYNGHLHQFHTQVMGNLNQQIIKKTSLLGLRGTLICFYLKQI